MSKLLQYTIFQNGENLAFTITHQDKAVREYIYSLTPAIFKSELNIQSLFVPEVIDETLYLRGTDDKEDQKIVIVQGPTKEQIVNSLDALVEAGVQIINPLQPDVNDSGAVKKRYGDRLSVWGNVDTRKIMSYGSAEDVVREVKQVISTLSPGGGHLLCSTHTIQSTPRALENTFAYYWAAHTFRSYPIRISDESQHAKVTRVV